MKITNVNTKLFLESLELVGNAIPSKSPMPILVGVLLKFDENKITLLGSDGNTAIKNVLYKNEETNNYILNENFECLVDYKMLKTLISKLYATTSVFYLKNNQFVIENGKSVYKLNSINLTDYPKFEFKKLENEITLRTQELKNIITKTSVSCSTSEKRPILTGVNFIGKNKELKCVATDTFRLSQYKIELEQDIKEFNFTFPKQSLIALLKIIEKTKEENIKILYNNSNDILINVDNTLYKTRLLDGKYPDTSRLISDVYPMNCYVDKDTLLNAIDRVSILGKDIENKSIVKLSFREDNSIIITSNNATLGNAKDLIECDCCDFGLEIACSGNYLLEALNTFDCDKVQICLSGEIRPIIIKKENNDKLVQVCLPVREV